MLFHNMKQTIIDAYLVCKFKQSNAGVSFGQNIHVKNPQYIECGSHVVIGEGSRLLCWDSYRGEQKTSPRIVLGNNVRATRNLTIQCANSVRIHDNVLIASDVFIIDYNHGMNPAPTSYLENPLDVHSVEICEGAWLCNNVIILPGVTIGKKSIIGAGSVVSKNIPDYSIAVGNPARVVKIFNHEIGQWVKVDNSDYIPRSEI